MNTEIEHLADHKIRMTVTVPADEFEISIDKAYKTLAKEVRLPGFRPGKAPRAMIEKQIGSEAGRAQALNDSIPQYYIDAVDANDIDPVDYPELKVTAGEEEGDLVFEATVAVRPVIKVSGYENLTVQVDVDPIDEAATERQLDLLRDRFASLEDVEGTIEDGMFATIDLSGSVDGEDVPGLTANDYLYEVGTGLIGPELDVQLRGKKAGDELEFTDTLSDNFGDNAGNEVEFSVTVKNVQNKILPEATDEWIKENTEFETKEAYEEDVLKRLENMRTLQAQMQVQQKVMESLGELVTDDVPEQFLEREIEARFDGIAQQSGATREQLQEYIDSLDDEAKEEFNGNVRKDAETAIKSDLAIRAIIVQEKLDGTDEELEAEIQKFAAQSKEKIGKIRNRISKPGVEKQVRLDIAREKAVKLVTEGAKATDSDGKEITLQVPGSDGDDMSVLSDVIAAMDDHGHDHDHEGHDHDHDHEH